MSHHITIHYAKKLVHELNIEENTLPFTKEKFGFRTEEIEVYTSFIVIDTRVNIK